jgi:polyribonucleotide nucleotidyltransferase
MGFESRTFGHVVNLLTKKRCGDTVIHAVVASESAENPVDSFLPLTVDFRNRLYASGQVSKNRKERHNTDEEVLASRVIDRSIRPLFPKGYVNNVQVTVTSQAIDKVADPVVLGVNASSFALLLSSQPWTGPIGCVRVGRIDDQLVVNPAVSELEASTLDLLYTGTESGNCLM